jgi:ferredoxin like protein
MTAEVNVKAKLGLDTIKVDDEQKHIQIDREICKGCILKPCLHVCPAQVYTLDKTGEIVIDLDGCLECGTCKIACNRKAIKWNYPHGGFGVQLRFG